jgi:two-component system, NarL family, invasion response regulator UvrY
MIRVLVVDDHELVLAGLCRILDAVADIEIVGSAGSGHQAVALCRTHKPDVVLLDYNLPDLDGLETTQQVIALGLGVRVLILTMYANEEYATRLLKAGASGFIIKDSPTSELLEAVHKVAARGVYVTPSIMDKMVQRIGEPDHLKPESALSDREMQVLTFLARGSLTREVAKTLSLSMSTVETYRSRIMKKLNLRTNADIARFAIKQGLIESD